MFIAKNEELSQIFIEIVLRCTAVKNRDRYIHRRVKVTVTDTWIYLPGQFYKKIEPILRHTRSSLIVGILMRLETSGTLTSSK